MSGLSAESKAALEVVKAYRQSSTALEGVGVTDEQLAQESARKATELGFTEETRNNRAFVLSKVAQNIGAFEYASDALKADQDFVREVVKLHPFALFYANQELKSNKEFISSLIAINPEVLRFADNLLREDIDLAKLL